MPTAMPMSYLPRRMVSAQSAMALAAVAQALNTSVNGMPVSPTRRVTESGLETSRLPPTPNWTSFQSTPASWSAAWIASAPIWMQVLSNRPNGWRPTPMMATSSMSQLLSHSGWGEGEGEDLVAFVVGVQRDPGELDGHAEIEFVGIALGEASLDANDVVELDETDPERPELVGTFVALVGIPR